MPGGRPRSDEKQRFLAKVKTVESGCHEWQSNFNRQGYGKFWSDGRTDLAHRVGYRLFKSEISAGLCVLHRCDNPKCVNTEHLFLGTKADNVRDMDQKKRRGSKSQFSQVDIAEIKRLLAERHSQAYVASLFGVHQTAISRISLGQTRLFKRKLN